MKRDPSSQALHYAQRLLSIKERTEREIEARLKDKGYKRESINEVIAYLRKKRFLDDERFAREWIKKSITSRPKGVAAIKHELLTRGLNENLIDNILKDADAGYNEYDVAMALADKKVKSFKTQDSMKRKKSLYGYLARRGFSFDVINDIIDTL